MTSPNLSTDLDKAGLFAKDTSVLEPLAAAMERAAVAIMSEDSTIPGHTLRQNLAVQVLQDPMALAPRFAWALSTNDEIVNQWTSEQRAGAIGSFQFVVNSVWNALASVTEPAVQTAVEPAP